MTRILRRLFGSEIELLLGLVLGKGLRKGARRGAPLHPQLSRSRPGARGKPRRSLLLEPRQKRIPPAAVELFAKARRSRSRIASGALSLAAHGFVIFLLVKSPVRQSETEDLGAIEIVLRRPPPPPAAPAPPPSPERKPDPPDAPDAPLADSKPDPEHLTRPPVPGLPLEEPVPPPPEDDEKVVTSDEKPTSDEPGFPGTGDTPRLEPEGGSPPPTTLGVGESPPGGDGKGQGGEGKGTGYGSRSTGRPSAIARYGGVGTEDAVSRGLAWLAAHQDASGGWAAADFGRHCNHFTQCLGKGLPEFDAGVTALAALAFLGAGQAPGAPGPYGGTVERALSSLLSRQRLDGAFGAIGEKFLYNHSIALFAVLETYGMTRDGRYLKPALSGIAFSARSQQAGGGWDYSDQPTGRNDLSITGWQAMAFRAAGAAGVPVPPETLNRLRAFLAAASLPGGEAVYATTGMGSGRRGANMTAVALLSRLYHGTSLESPWAQAAADRLMAHPPDWKLVADWDRSFQSSYYWYAATLCLFHMGGQRWEAWNHFLKQEILPLQSRAPHEEGSWPPDPNWLGAMGGRVFTTAMNVLTLEVYYRYPPLHTYRTMAGAEAGASGAAPGG